jgi:hypothetical protein
LPAAVSKGGGDLRDPCARSRDGKKISGIISRS